MSEKLEDRNYKAETAPLTALSHPDHIWLFDYWQRLRPDAGLPSRKDIDPTDFPRLLPRIAVIAAEAAGGGIAYRYRLAGTEVVARAGRDPTGKTFAELYEGDYLKSATALYDERRRAAQPHFS